MTTLRTAAQQALEALEEVQKYGTTTEWFDGRVSALRAALAEPVQEPVAWIQPDHLQKARVAPFLCRVEPTQRCSDFVALFTAPPQRKPLTEEEILSLFRTSGSPTAFARAIERAYGIT